MTQRGPGGHGDDHLSDQFLVDGVAPSVIGDGPPESPFDITPDAEPPGRPRQPAQPGHHQEIRQEPPTAPIPAFRQAAPQQEKRKSWIGRMFRG